MADDTPGYRELPNGMVQLTITSDDYALLMFVLGAAVGDAENNPDEIQRKALGELVNRLNTPAPTTS